MDIFSEATQQSLTADATLKQGEVEGLLEGDQRRWFLPCRIKAEGVIVRRCQAG
jgi:hypothetical protein